MPFRPFFNLPPECAIEQTGRRGVAYRGQVPIAAVQPFWSTGFNPDSDSTGDPMSHEMSEPLRELPAAPNRLELAITVSGWPRHLAVIGNS